MRIRKNSWATIARLVLRELRRWLFPNERDDRIKINKAKGRARIVDGHEMSVTRRIPTIDGCYLQLYCLQNPAEDYSVTVFVANAVGDGSVVVKVIFCEQPQEKLYSVYKTDYLRRVGAYLRVAKVR